VTKKKTFCDIDTKKSAMQAVMTMPTAPTVIMTVTHVSNLHLRPKTGTGSDLRFLQSHSLPPSHGSSPLDLAAA
jgi:hypothetical protein